MCHKPQILSNSQLWVSAAQCLAESLKGNATACAQTFEFIVPCQRCGICCWVKLFFSFECVSRSTLLKMPDRLGAVERHINQRLNCAHLKRSVTLTQKTFTSGGDLGVGRWQLEGSPWERAQFNHSVRETQRVLLRRTEAPFGSGLGADRIMKLLIYLHAFIHLIDTYWNWVMHGPKTLSNCELFGIHVDLKVCPKCMGGWVNLD